MSRVQYLWKKKMINTLAQFGLSEALLISIERYFDGLTDESSLQQLTQLPVHTVSPSAVIQLYENYQQWIKVHDSQETNRLIFVICRLAGVHITDWLAPDLQRVFQWTIRHWLDDQKNGCNFSAVLQTVYRKHPEWFVLYAQTVPHDVKWLLYSEMIAFDPESYAHLESEMKDRIVSYVMYLLEQQGFVEPHAEQWMTLLQTGTPADLQQALKSEPSIAKVLRIGNDSDVFLRVSFRLSEHHQFYRNLFDLHMLLDETRTTRSIVSFIQSHYVNEIHFPEALERFRDRLFSSGFGTAWIRWLVEQVKAGTAFYGPILMSETTRAQQAYHQAMLGSFGLDYVILYEQVMHVEHPAKSVHKLERSLTDELLDLFAARLGERRQTYVYTFLAGRWPLELLVDRLRNQIPANLGGSFPFERYLWLQPVIPQYDRAVQLLWIGDDYKSLIPVCESYISRFGFSEWLDWTERLQVNHTQILSLCLFATFQDERSVISVSSFDWIEDQWKNQSDLILMNWQAYSVKARVYLISQWMEHDRERMGPMLEQLTQDRSKRVQRLFVESQPYHPLWQSPEERAAELAESGMDQPVASATIPVTSDPADECSNDGQAEQSVMTVARKTGERGRPKKIALDWIQWSRLPAVLKKDGNESAPSSWLQDVMVCYARHGGIEWQPEAIAIADQLDNATLKDWVFALYQQWLADGAETKKKWVMVLAVLHGDERVIASLTEKLDEWPRNARGTISVDAMRAMALSNRDAVLVHLASIAQESKIRQVRENAKEILEKFSDDHQLDRELFYDRLIPAHGFLTSRERLFDYGNRSFRVKLNDDLQFEITDSWNKSYKALPVPTRNDHQDWSHRAWEEMKWLKKQMPLTVSRQQARFQEVLVHPRFWTVADWKQRLVMHPVMHSFVKGTLWGIYDQGRLIKPFIYPLAEEQIDVERYRIGIVHPAEMIDEEIQYWMGQVQLNQATVNIRQLNRTFVRPADESDCGKNRFTGQIVRGDRLKAQLESRGWQMGSLQEKGHIFTFYRENAYSGIGVQLSFSGMPVSETHQEVSLESVRFYKAGAVIRGHYHTDEIPEHAELGMKQIPLRTWSEAIADIQGAL